MNSGVETSQPPIHRESDDAFAEIVRRYVNLVHSVAQRRLGNAALAEEATQLVFIKLAKSRPRFPAEPALIAWLHRTATNVATDLLRSELRRRQREQEAIAMQNDADPNLEELARLLDCEIDQLPHTDREIILLRFFGKLRMADLGATLGISEDAAKMRVSRAVENLRQRVTRAGAICGTAALLGFLTTKAITPAPASLAASVLSTTANIATSVFAPFFKLALAAIIAAASLITLINLSSFKNPPNSTTIAVKKTDAPKSANEPIRNRSTTAPQLFLTLNIVNAETGAPVPNALILQDLDQFAIPTQEDRFVSDADGQAEIPLARLERYRFHNLFVIAEGFVPHSITWDQSSYTNRNPQNIYVNVPTPTTHTFRLDPARTFFGRVLDEEGSLVPGVQIRVIAPSSQDATFNRAGQEFFSDAGGNWRIPYIPKWWSDADLLLEREGFARTLVNIPTRPESPDTADIVIKRGAIVRGRITDEQGTPIPNAALREIISGGSTQMNYLQFYNLSQRTNQSNANGEFQFAGIVSLGRSNRAYFDVSAEGYVPEVVNVPLNAATNALNVTMEKSHLLRGKILDQYGHPLPESQILTTPPGDPDAAYKVIFKTDADGRFESGSAPLEANYLVSYSEPNAYAHTNLTLKADGTEHEILLEVKRLPSPR